WKPMLHTVFVAMIPFLIGGFIAFLFHPLVEKIQHFGLKRGWAILIIYTIFFGGIGISFYFGLPLLIERLNDFSKQLPVLAEQYKDGISNIQASASRWP